MADHRTLISADVHEPKHVSGTTAADAGKVITPLSGGTSELRLLTASEISGLNLPVPQYGEMLVTQNADPTAVTGAAVADSDLYNDADYVPVDIAAATLNNADGITLATGPSGLTVSTAGVYKVTAWANMESDTNNSKVGFRYAINGVLQSPVAKTDIKEIGRVTNITTSSLMSLTAGMTVSIAIASDKTAGITIKDMEICMQLLKEV